MRSPASTTSFTVLITVLGLINVPSITLAQTTTTTGSPQATNTNLVLNFAPIPTLYACAAYSFQWTLPSDLTNGARSQLVDLFVTNENIDQVIPGGSGSTASDSSVTSSGGSISSALTGGSSRAGSSSISSSGSISRSSTLPAVPSSTIATPTTRPTSTTSSISTPTRPARRFVPRAAPTGSSIITKNITLISASSNQYTYPHVVLPLGRYILYAQARGDGTGKILGASNSFTVLRGGNPTCLNGTDSGSDGGQDDGGGSNGSTTGTIAGAVVGSILGTLLLAFLAFWLWRKRQRKTIWLSQSSLRMFSPPSEPRGIRGFFARGRGKRDSKESGRRGLNVQEETTEISGPTLMSTSGWRDHPSNPNSAGLENGYLYDREVKLGNEEKQTQNGRDIELTRLQHAPIGLNIPVLPKEPDRSGHISKPSAGSDPSPEKNGGEYSSSSTETSPATASSASNSWDTHGYLYGPERTESSTMDEFGKAHSRGSRNLTGLQRNPSSGSTTLGRSLSSKRMSSGPGGPVKRKPVPLMPQGQAQGQGQGQGQGHSNHSSLDEVYSTTRPVHLEGVGRTESSEEMLTDRSVFPARPAHKQNREGQEEGQGMSRQSSSSSLAPSSSGSTVRPPGLAREGKRRESFLLIPDQPLSQD